MKDKFCVNKNWFVVIVILILVSGLFLLINQTNNQKQKYAMNSEAQTISSPPAEPTGQLISLTPTPPFNCKNYFNYESSVNTLVSNASIMNTLDPVINIYGNGFVILRTGEKFIAVNANQSSPSVFTSPDGKSYLELSDVSALENFYGDNISLIAFCFGTITKVEQLGINTYTGKLGFKTTILENCGSYIAPFSERPKEFVQLPPNCPQFNYQGYH